MKQLIRISSFLILLLMFACQSADKPSDTGEKYFRHLKFSETPFDQIRGLHSITASEAAEINHYRFSYDEDGRLTSVKYCRGEELLNGSQTGAPMIKISYQENKEVHSYFDIKGELKNRQGYRTAEYTLDGNGVRKELRFLDSEGNPVENSNNIAWFEWKILANGQLKENRFNLNGEETVLNEFCPFYELRFTYDAKGFPVNMANYQGDTMYNCTVENCGDIGVSYFAFEYNDAGDLTQLTVSHLNGQLSNLYWGWAKFQNKYDEHGNVLENAMFDQDDELLGGMNVPVTQMVYDDHGALVERKFMNPDRNLMNHPQSGIALSRYSYDEKGHPKDTLTFNSELGEI